MIIRRATLRDYKACYNLSNIRELLDAKGDPIPLSYFRDIAKSTKSIFLVAEEKKQIIGYSTADVLPGKVAIWWLLRVKPEFQKKGIGTMLAKEIEKQLRKKGIKYIVGYSPKFNKNTLAFHKRLGFNLGEEMIEILKVLK